MLKVINLYVIDCIFKEANCKIGQRAKMLYINCLIHHFSNKKPSVASIVAFDLLQEEFGDFSKYQKLFIELEKAGLVQVGMDKIAFHNLWGAHINHSELEKVSADEYVAGFNFYPPTHYMEDLKKSHSLIQVAQSKYSISESTVIDLIDVFVKQQEAFEKKYTSYSDFAKHFIFWIKSNVTKENQEKVVKSNNKLLGL